MHADGESMETLAVHGGERRPGPGGSVVFPIYQGTVYAIEPGTSYHDLPYLRLSSTPSQRYLHDKLAALEGAESTRLLVTTPAPQPFTKCRRSTVAGVLRRANSG